MYRDNTTTRVDLLAAASVVLAAAAWFGPVVEASDQAPPAPEAGDEYEPTDEELEEQQQQIAAIFRTIFSIVGTVIAIIVGFYGWTFWTSVKCYFESQAVKKLNKEREQAAKAAEASGSARNTDNNSDDGSENSSKGSLTCKPVSSAAEEESDTASEKNQATCACPLARNIRPIGPYHLKGEVVKGFGRGSTELGWPTANLDPVAFEHKIDDSEEGVYFGWAQIVEAKRKKHTTDKPPQIYKAVVSIGWNPAYDNEKKTVEAFLCNEFEENFYGDEMRLLIVGYVRKQAKFSGENWLAELKNAIRCDVDTGKAALDNAPYAAFASDPLFLQ